MLKNLDKFLVWTKYWCLLCTVNNSGPGIGELIFHETEEWVFASSTTGVEGRSLT